MANKVHVRKGDTVFIRTGKAAGQRGRVLSVFPDTGRVIVEGANKVIKHKKARQMDPGGIVKQEAAIHASNVMLICEKCKSPTRIGKRVLEDGEKVRVCKKCDEVIDTIIVKKGKAGEWKAEED